jgi:hypothetical protein
VTTQREYAQTEIFELERLLVAAPEFWLRLLDDPDNNIPKRNTQAAARSLIANLRARLPKLLALWDAAREHNADAVRAALESLDAPLHKKETPWLPDKNPYPNEECKGCLCNMRSGCELAQEWNRKKAGL